MDSCKFVGLSLTAFAPVISEETCLLNFVIIEIHTSLTFRAEHRLGLKHHGMFFEVGHTDSNPFGN